MKQSDCPIRKWSSEKARQWYAQQPWLAGCNFIPSTAVNQLEMWQADTFDPETIERELKWAAGLGFNSVRVFLHDLAWHQDAKGFKERINHFLDIAYQHKIKAMFVFFDDCWRDDPRPGKQPAPRPGIHNSGWVKSPGTKVLKNPAQWDRLEGYVRDIVGTFGSDDRVLVWDIYNEPGNNFLISMAMPPARRNVKLIGQLLSHFLLPPLSKPLVVKAFHWARLEQPVQPLTAGVWYLAGTVGSRLNRLLLDQSDVLSFHSYFNLETTIKIVSTLKKFNRPLFCTEYLARGMNCLFETHLPYYRQEKIAAFNWGLVNGKTQTHYSWWDYYPYGEEPPIWYHDILRRDGTCYRAEEGEFLRKTLLGQVHDGANPL